jgi:hypothetical protein
MKNYKKFTLVFIFCEKPVVVLQTLVFNNKQIYLFLWSVPEQKLDFFTAYMVVFFDKTCPYKITDRKIIKVEHNIIDSSRCLIFIV